MSHNVETMFYTREKPWHGLGTMVAEAPNSAEALELAGLNWNVTSRPIFTDDFREIPHWRSNIRESDDAILGIVSDRYKIVQNREAFEFTDSLIGGDVRYETAGSLSGGRRVWLLARMPAVKILDDETEPYLCFTNSFDGTGAIKVCMTPVRVVCNNTLNLALSGAKRSWSAKHMGDMDSKIAEARTALELASRYMTELDAYAGKLANKKVTDDEIRKILDELFPIEEDSTEAMKKTAIRARNEYMVCYNMPDIRKYYGTAWGAVNAMADMADHTRPKRMTRNYAENNWSRIIDGHVLVDKIASMVAVKN